MKAMGVSKMSTRRHSTPSRTHAPQSRVRRCARRRRGVDRVEPSRFDARPNRRVLTPVSTLFRRARAAARRKRSSSDGPPSARLNH